MKRLISLVLAISLCLSLAVITAPSASAYNYNPIPSQWSLFAQGLMNWFSDSYGQNITTLESNLNLPYTGRVTRMELEKAREYFNNWIITVFRTVDITPSVNGVYAAITYVPSDGIYRLIDNSTNQYIVDSLGRFPYSLAEDMAGDTPAQSIDTSVNTANKWVDPRQVSFDRVVVLSYDVLALAVQELNNRGVNCTLRKVKSDTLWAIVQNISALPMYSNSAGYVYVASAQSSATEIKYDYIDNSTNTTINDSQIIDVTDGILNIINENGEKKTLIIDSLNFDFSDKSYTVNAYDIVYDNDIYTYNYYTYNVSYTYNYTYITYIGSTAEYEAEEYALYYELPDGRSSADLTADEIAGMVLDFEIINYDIAYNDTQTMALYSFDGTWANKSAYTNYGLTWSNSSVTYLDSGTFGGAIYLDGANHSFNSNAAVGTAAFDAATNQFTLQFRLYVDQVGGNDYTYFGAEQRMYNNGWGSGGTSCIATLYQNKLYWGAKTGHSIYTSSSVIAPLSSGTWNEVCFTYINNAYRCYINGVLKSTNVGSVSGVVIENYGVNLAANPWNRSEETTSWNKPVSYYSLYASTLKWTGFTMAYNLTYYNGVSSGYSQGVNNTFQTDQTKNSGVRLDNVRFVNTCLYTASQYIPAAVPYETNLVLVLPNSSNLDDNTILVMSEIPVSGYRIGGVRPTFPAVGMVWLAVGANRITECQIFNGSIWESVEGRIWTGIRFIPLWSFDVVTLADMWDMSNAEDVAIAITTEYAFWNWWQVQWLDFRGWLTSNWTTGGSSGGGSVPSDPTSTSFPGGSDDSGNWSFLDLLTALKDGAWSITTGTVTVFFGGVTGVISSVVSVGDFFGAYNSGGSGGVDSIFGILDYGGADIWD
ncbi:hypothetical protein SDC9_65422 [bioreactor metagenome]|uniref:Uncharacterized protein n=1 Tax=bioreactor metagenome TaxID=1076179 RepID=A0A644XY91_9ZZZZ